MSTVIQIPISQKAAKPGFHQRVDPPKDAATQDAAGRLRREMLVSIQENGSLLPRFSGQDKEFDGS